MSARYTATVHLASPEATAALAQALAPSLQPGDTLLLDGQIGAGKTHFARALIQARLGVTGRAEDVPSPTFTIVQVYDDGVTEIWHADLYRLTNAAEISELGLEDAFDAAICLVEWPDRMGAAAPKAALRLHFAPGEVDDARILNIEADHGVWAERIRTVLGEDARHV